MITGKQKNSPAVESVLGAVDTFVRWKEKTAPDRKYDIYHPSAFGKCLREMQYKAYAAKGYIKVIEEDHDSRVLRLWEKGHNMQSRWEKYFDGLGVLRGVWQCINPMCRQIDDDGVFQDILDVSKNLRVYGKDDLQGCFKPDKCVCGSTKFAYNEVSVSAPEYNMFGHADIILDFSRFNPDRFDGIIKSFNMDTLPKKPVVVDMKTINQNGFDGLDKFGKPPSFGYQIQLTIYAHLLDCEFGILIYECKNNSYTKAYKIERDDKSWALIQRQAKLMMEMALLKNGDGKPLCLLPPPRPEKNTGWGCKNCAFKKHCFATAWKDDKLDEKRKNFYGHLLED